MEPTNRNCPRCGLEVPKEAPRGLCARCLLVEVAAPTEEEGVEGGGAVGAVPAMEWVAEAFPQLEILGLVGRGGMGVVYRARQRSLDRIVALKLLIPERSGDVVFADHFSREARALAALSHPHIVTVHDFGRSGPFYFLLMECMDGPNLREVLRSRRLTPEEALGIVPALCEALQYAHDRGIVHRDIKPENLLFDRDGRVKIADFGIARMMSGTGEEAGVGVGVGEEARVVGTPGYMAPEQRTAPGVADSRADIFSLGTVLYEMLTGELPRELPEPPSRRVRIDVRLDEVVLRALERSPERRYQTARTLQTDLAAVLRGESAASAALAPGSATGSTGGAGSSVDRLASASASASVAVGVVGRSVGGRGRFSTFRRPWLAGLGFSILWVVWAMLGFGGRFRTGEAVLAGLFALLGVVAGLAVSWLLYRICLQGWRPARPSGGRILAVALLGTSVIFVGSHRLARGSTQRAARIRHDAARVAEAAARVEEAKLRESEARLALAGFETDPSAPEVGGRGSVEQTEHYRRLTRAVAEASEQVRVETVGFQGVGRRLSVTRSTRMADRARAVLPLTVPVVAVVVLVMRGRRAGGGLGGGGFRHGAMDIVLGVGGLGAMLVMAGVLDRRYRASPEGFDDLFVAPSRPPLEGLGWRAVGTSNEVLFVEVETQLERWSAEARWEFLGPGLPDSLGSALADPLERRPAGILLEPREFPGNATWTILRPGRQTTRLAWVFPEAGLAEEAFRAMSNRVLGPVERTDEVGGTWFHLFRPGREFTGRFGIAGVLHAGNPDWVTSSGRRSFNREGCAFTWNVSVARPGRLVVRYGDEETAVSIAPGPAGRPGTDRLAGELRIELQRLGEDRVRRVRVVGGRVEELERPGSYRRMLEELRRTASLGTKCRRGMSTELFRLEGTPCVIRVEDELAGQGAR